MLNFLPVAEWLGVGWLYWWQPLLLLAMIGLLIFWKVYRNKQM